MLFSTRKIDARSRVRAPQISESPKPDLVQPIRFPEIRLSLKIQYDMSYAYV
jgi:hypothetical protein